MLKPCNITNTRIYGLSFISLIKIEIIFTVLIILINTSKVKTISIYTSFLL